MLRIENLEVKLNEHILLGRFNSDILDKLIDYNVQYGKDMPGVHVSNHTPHEYTYDKLCTDTLLLIKGDASPIHNVQYCYKKNHFCMPMISLNNERIGAKYHGIFKIGVAIDLKDSMLENSIVQSVNNDNINLKDLRTLALMTGEKTSLIGRICLAKFKLGKMRRAALFLTENTKHPEKSSRCITVEIYYETIENIQKKVEMQEGIVEA